MDIKFLRGLLASLPATRDDKTFYYTTDSHQLWLGNYLLSNEITSDQFSALEGRVKSLEDAKFQDQIDAINESLKNFGTSDTIVALDGRVTALENWKNGLPAYVTEEVYNAHLTAQSEKDVAQDKALTDYKAEMVTALAGKEEAGAAAKALSDAKDYSDGKLQAVVEQYLTGEGAADTIDTLTEIAEWLNSDTAGVSQIIKDVAANTTNIGVVSGDLDKVELRLNGIAEGDGTVKAAIDAALAEAKKYADDNDANTVYDDTALSNRVGALEGKVDVEKVSTAIATATADMATNSSVDTKLAAYTKTADLGDLATKDEADLNLGQYAKTAEIEGSLAKAESALQAADLADYAKTADIEDSLAKAESAIQEADLAPYAKTADVEATYLKIADKYDDTDVKGRLDVIEAKPAMGITADDISSWNAEKGAKELAGTKATLAEVKDAYIGDTNAKLIDVVKAVNMLAEGSEATDKVVESVATNVKDIEAQLTWGTF